MAREVSNEEFKVEVSEPETPSWDSEMDTFTVGIFKTMSPDATPPEKPPPMHAVTEFVPTSSAYKFTGYKGNAAPAPVYKPKFAVGDTLYTMSSITGYNSVTDDNKYFDVGTGSLEVVEVHAKAYGALYDLKDEDGFTYQNCSENYLTDDEDVSPCEGACGMSDESCGWCETCDTTSCQCYHCGDCGHCNCVCESDEEEYDEESTPPPKYHTITVASRGYDYLGATYKLPKLPDQDKIRFHEDRLVFLVNEDGPMSMVRTVDGEEYEVRADRIQAVPETALPWEERGTIIPNYVSAYPDKLWTELWPGCADYHTIKIPRLAADFYLLTGLASGAFAPSLMKFKMSDVKLQALADKLGISYESASQIAEIRQQHIAKRAGDGVSKAMSVMDEASERLEEVIVKTDTIFWDYGQMACWGELRHHPTIKQRYQLSGNRYTAWASGYYIYEAGGVETLKDMAKL